MKGQDKKIDIARNNVIKNVKIYSSQLAGHYYLYIFVIKDLVTQTCVYPYAITNRL